MARAPGAKGERARLARAADRLGELLAALPDALRRRALTHSSWTERRLDSYGRLAFLGDGVLGLAIAEDLLERFPRDDIGQLTKVHGQAVSGRACAEVARAMGLGEMLAAQAPRRGADLGVEPETLQASERAMASVLEAVIGACYIEHGFARTAEATVAAFEPEIERATETLLDFKSALQEEVARDGDVVTYAVVREEGPAHDRHFEVEARVAGEVVGFGEGRTKKAAEQAAAAAALERL